MIIISLTLGLTGTGIGIKGRRIIRGEHFFKKFLYRIMPKLSANLLPN
jgi:hypothetical protein